MQSIAAVILAAGESARLGQPKQLLHFEGTTLLERAAQSAREAGCEPVVVVLGAELKIEVGKAERVVNPHARLGLGTSVRAGVHHVSETHPAATGVLLWSCDQPLVRAKHLRALLERQATGGAGIVAARYADTLGIPAIFMRAHFAELLELPDAEGAKGIILRHRENVAEVAISEAVIDIDTPAQWTSLRSRFPNS